MTIKKIGGGPPVAPTESTHGTSKPEVRFSEVAQTSSSAEGPKDDVAIAVRNVAHEISSGRLQTPQERVDAVIEELVRQQAPDGASPKRVRERVAEVQLALGDHPGFTKRVHAMIERTIAGLEE